MTEQQQEPITGEPKKGGCLSLIIKFFIFLVLLGAVMIMVLSALGGKNDALKDSIEQFLGQRFGGTATIDTLHQMTFYPYIGADFEGIRISRGDGDTQMVMRADRMSAAIGFWDVAFGTGKIRTLRVDNLLAVPGTLMNRGVTINRFALIDEGDRAFLRGDGKIASDAFRFEAEMRKSGQGKRRKYYFGDERPFSMQWGALQVSGIIRNMTSDQLEIHDFLLHDGAAAKLSGRLDVFHGGGYRVKLQGELNFAGGSVLYPDILFDMDRQDPQVSGALDFTPLNSSDLDQYAAFKHVIDFVSGALLEEGSGAAAARGQNRTQNQRTKKPLSGTVHILSGMVERPHRLMTNAAAFPDLAQRSEATCMIAALDIAEGAADVSEFYLRFAEGQAVRHRGHFDFDTGLLTLASGDAAADDSERVGTQTSEAIFLETLRRDLGLGRAHPCFE
ncbi:MAG: hypothetical protein ACK4VI_00750 [Alphaproteobacteria bacterium]